MCSTCVVSVEHGGGGTVIVVCVLMRMPLVFVFGVRDVRAVRGCVSRADGKCAHIIVSRYGRLRLVTRNGVVCYCHLNRRHGRIRRHRGRDTIGANIITCSHVMGPF